MNPLEVDHDRILRSQVRKTNNGMLLAKWSGLDERIDPDAWSDAFVAFVSASNALSHPHYAPPWELNKFLINEFTPSEGSLPAFEAARTAYEDRLYYKRWREACDADQRSYDEMSSDKP